MGEKMLDMLKPPTTPGDEEAAKKKRQEVRDQLLRRDNFSAEDSLQNNQTVESTAEEGGSSSIIDESGRITRKNSDPSEIPETELEAEAKPDLVRKYLLFKEKAKPKCDVIYHPCGETDISPSVAFPESRVVYVDINGKAMKALKKQGYEAHTVSALEFDPGNIDILIMINPAISPDIPSSHIIENGYVLCNDYHGTSTDFHGNPNYELKAIIRTIKNEAVYDTEKPEEYWQEIDNGEDFKNAPFNWGALNYEEASSVVEAITGKKENVLAEYKKIIEMARERARKANANLSDNEQEELRNIAATMAEEILILNHNGRIFHLETGLPRKKGTADDIFVFQKLKKLGIS